MIVYSCSILVKSCWKNTCVLLILWLLEFFFARIIPLFTTVVRSNILLRLTTWPWLNWTRCFPQNRWRCRPHQIMNKVSCTMCACHYQWIGYIFKSLYVYKNKPWEYIHALFGKKRGKVEYASIIHGHGIELANQIINENILHQSYKLDNPLGLNLLKPLVSRHCQRRGINMDYVCPCKRFHISQVLYLFYGSIFFVPTTASQR